MDSNFQSNSSSDDKSVIERNSCVSSFDGNDCHIMKSASDYCETTGSLQKIYKCNHNKCDATFYRNCHLQDHLNRHIGIRSYQCKEKDCSKAYFAWKNLKKHLTNVHKMENVRKSLYVPLLTHHRPKDRTHKCSYEGCNAEFSRRWRLASHMSQHTGVKLYSCSIINCNKTYSTIGHLHRHIAKIHTPQTSISTGYLCTKEGCKKVCRSFQNFRKHYARHYTNQFKCCPCDKYFATADLLALHEAKHYGNPPYKCIKEDCKKHYCSLESLRNHYYKHHANDKLAVSSFKCLSRDEFFTSSALSAFHAPTQHENSPYKCEKCNQSFYTLILWKEHMKTHKSFICHELGCNQVFLQYTLLQEHKKLAHVKSISCEICEKTFRRKSNLKKHQETHLSRDERELFVCPYSDCTRCYTRNYYLAQHIKSRHESKRFVCFFPGCEASLVTKQKLQEHLKIHDPSRPPLIRKQIARRQRKDAGLPKRSMAVKLSGVKVSYAEEKLILCSKPGSREGISYDSSHKSSGAPETNNECSELLET